MPRLTTRQKMTAARSVQRPLLAVRRLLSKGPVVTAQRRHVRWELDLREGIDFAIWLQGYFERSTVQAYRRELRPGSTVVDIGANIGAHTLHLARAVGESGHVIAFEPSETAFAKLTRNVAANPELGERITLHQAMLLGAADAELPTSVVSSWPLLPHHELDPTMPGRPQPTTGALATTLDRALCDAGTTSVALIKLDVDGFECDVIDGAGETLERHQPVVLTELAPSVAEVRGQSVEKLVERFAANDYQLTTLRGEPVRPRDIDRLLTQRASINVFARPSGAGRPGRSP